MATITAEIIASVLAANAEGKKPGTIAMTLKIKKAEVESIIAGTITADTLVAPVVTEEVITEEPKVDAGTTNALIDQLKAQQAQVAQAAGATSTDKPARKPRTTTTLVQVQTSSSKDAEGNNIQRRNLNCPVRAVAVFFAEVAGVKTAWLGTHLSFGTKTAPAAMKVMVGDTATKCLLPLQNLEKAAPGSVQMVIEARDVAVGPELEAAKLTAFIKYRELGYNMLGRDLAKSADAAAAKAAKDAAKAAAQPAPVTEVQPEQTEADKLAEELASPEADALAVQEAELLAAELAQDQVEA